MSANCFNGDRDLLGPYCRYLADQMGLRDWFLEIGKTTPQEEDHPDGVAATCDPGEGRKYAVLRFREDWEIWDEDRLRHICVHELLHCHFASIRDPLHTLEGLIGGLLFSTSWDATTNAMEYCIDGIAYDWGRLLPTPAAWLEAATDPEEV